MTNINIAKLVQESISNISSQTNASDVDYSSLDSKLSTVVNEAMSEKFKHNLYKRGLVDADEKVRAWKTDPDRKAAMDSVEKKQAFRNNPASAGPLKTKSHGVRKSVVAGALAAGGAAAAGTVGAGKYMAHKADEIASAAKHLADVKSDAVKSAAEKASTVQGKISKYGSELKSAASGAMDSVKNMSPKTQAALAGTAGVLGAGLAAKRYMAKRRKK